jgi:hypothetical protein
MSASLPQNDSIDWFDLIWQPLKLIKGPGARRHTL